MLSNCPPNIYVYTHMLLSALLREMSFSVGTNDNKHLWLPRVLRWYWMGHRYFPLCGSGNMEEKGEEKRKEPKICRCALKNPASWMAVITWLLYSRIWRHGSYSDKIKLRVRPLASHHIFRRKSRDLTPSLRSYRKLRITGGGAILFPSY